MFKEAESSCLLFIRRSRLRSIAGFTLLELIIVLVIISLILGLSTVLFTKSLSSGKLDAIMRDFITTIKYARTTAQSSGVSRTVIIDIDSRKFGIEGRNMKDIPRDFSIRVVDPLRGEVLKGSYRITFHGTGGVEGGTVILSGGAKTVNIHMDPVVGAVVMKQ